jgi:energy-converting hydrogenase Eha subunit A
MTNQTRLILWTGVLTGLCLGGTLSFPFWYGLSLYYVPVNIREQFVGYLSLDSLVDIWLPSIVLGGLIWCLALARLSGVRPVWRLCLGGGLGVLLGGVVATSTPFPRLFGALWPQAPVHIRWITNLVLGVGLGAGITALALGLGIRWERSALKLAFGVFLAASLPALIVALGLDAVGIRWGMGNANMAKIAGLAFPAAAISAGLLIGWYLARYQH